MDGEVEGAQPQTQETETAIENMIEHHLEGGREVERGSREEERRQGEVHSTDTEKVHSIPHSTPKKGGGKGEGSQRTYSILYPKNERGRERERERGEGRGKGREGKGEGAATH